MQAFWLFVVILAVAAASASATYQRTYAGHKVFRVQVTTEAELKRLALLEPSYDFWIEPRIGFVDIMARPDQHLELWLRGYEYQYKVQIPDVGALIHEERLTNRQGKAIDWTNYHNLETLHAFVDDIAAQYPDLASVISIGKSTENRDLKVIKIGREGAAENKPAMWIDAGIHAREWISPAITSWMINELLTNSNKYEDILESIDFYILISANPDGYEWTHNPNGSRLWRKTRSDQNSAFGCKGVDPNRNFEHYWGGEGTSADKCSEIYKGPEPWSEPETKAMRDFILGSTNVNWQLYIALHSYAQMILTPWGYTYDLPEDYAELKSLGLEAAEALTAVHGTQYDVGSVTEILSPGAGGSDDWAKGLGGFKYSYTIEVRDTGRYGFILPANQIIPTAEETWEAVQVMARHIGQKAKL